MPKKKVLAAAVAIALSAPVYEAYAQSVAPTTLPTGGRVVAGQATIGQSGATMQIQQGSARAALDWNSFSIGSQAAVTFNQPSASAIALNRVLGNDPSQIYGRLSANGQVFLLNPNGVLFARGAQVDVGGIVASTLTMSSDDFMAGRYRLSGGGNGSVVNQGDIKGRSVVLVGPHVTNDGTIEAQSGTISLVGAGAATLDYMADGLVQIRVDQGALQAEVANNGLLRADGGSVALTAKSLDSLARSVVNNTGIIEARSVETVDGVVRLGAVKLLADEVNVTGNARIDTSGERGGGGILIGGNYQGKGPEANALTTTVGADAVIAADAHRAGDGGKVIVWSDDKTSVHGSISARGGAESGNGGFIETSGHSLDVSGMRISASAPNGRAGQLLLDPGSVTIDHSATSGSFNPTGATATIGDSFIASTLNGGTDVTITTSSGSGGTGDITVNGAGDAGGAATITNASGGARTLTLLANRDINIHTGAFITGSASNSLAVVLKSNQSDSGGAINIAGSTISTFGGDLQLVGGSSGSGFAVSRADGFGGVWLSGGSVLDASTGSVTIKGQGFGGASDYAVVVVDSSVTAGGTMDVYATGHLAVLSTGTAAGQLNSTGLQTVNVSKTLFVQGADGGTSKFSQISSNGGQAITADGIVILAGGNTGGGGFNTGNYAQIANQSPTVGQGVTVYSGGIALTAGGGASPITDNYAGLFSAYSQNVTVNSGGIVSLQGGSSGGTAGTTGQHGSRAFIGTGSTSPSQQISFASGGSIQITGGTVGTRNFATINAGAGNQTITGSPTIMLTGGSSGGITNEENFGSINAVSGNQTIYSGPMTITGGGSGSTVNYAGVNAPTQTIVVNGNLAILGDASGPARIGGPGGANTNLTLTVHGNAALTAGTVSTAGARIGSNGAGGFTHNIGMTVDGNLTLNGGTGQAWIGTPSSNPGNGNISITMTGLSGPGNILINSQTASASIRTSGSLDIGTPGDITVSAGSGTSASALIGSPDIYIQAGSLNLTGGSVAANNSGAISSCILSGTSVCTGGTVEIHVTGDTVLTGGSSSSSAGFIGLGGTGDLNTGTVTFVGGGNLTLNAGPGSQAAAAIGAGGTQTNANVLVDLKAANVILNDSSTTLARIGHSSAAPGPGNVIIEATAGNISLNSNFSSGTAIRTTDNVTLHADASGGSIIEGANSIIAANTLTTTSVAGTNLAGTGNIITSFTATNTVSGGISLVNGGPLSIASIVNSGPGLISVSNGGDITLTGSVSGLSDIALTANAGNIIGGAGRVTTTGGSSKSIILSGDNIGASGAPVLTDAGNGTLVLNPTPSGGNVYISNNSAGGMFGPGGTQISSSLSAIADSNTFSLKQTAGNIQIADEGILFDQGGGTGQNGTLILDASAGSIIYRGDLPGTLGGPLVHARNVTLHAAGDVGTSTSRVLVDAQTLTARSDSGNVFLEVNPNRSFISTSPGTAMVQRVYPNATLQDQAGFSNGAPSGTYDVIAGTGSLGNAGPITAQTVTFTADKMALSGSINAGSGTVILQPANPATAIDIGSFSDAQANTLELSAAELATVTAGTLQIGRTDSTGNLNFSGVVLSSDVNASLFRVVANNVTASGAGGIGFNFNHNVEMWGNNDVGPGTLTLADGRNLTIIADRDNNQSGNVLFNGNVNVGTSAANTGSMAVSGENINFFSNATVFSNTIVNGSGSQTFTARNQINIDNQADGGINITTGTGTQTFSTVAGGMTMTAGIGTLGAGSGLTTMNAGGNQTFSIAGGLSIQSRGGSSVNADAAISASGNQSITAQYVELISNGLGDAGIFMNSGAASQTVTTSGANAFGAGVYVQAQAATSSAYLQTGATGGQTINVNGAGNDLKIIGTGGSARIASFPNAPQIVNVSDVLLVGGAGTAGGSVLQANGAQTITANGIQIIGGSGSSPTNIQTSGNQNVTAGSGGISITAGSNAGGASPASINQFGASGTQVVTVNGGNVSVLGGTVSPNNIANISNSGTAQTVTVNNAASVLVAGQIGGANIGSTGTQTVIIQGGSANALTVGSATSAGISGINGNSQVVTVGTPGQSGSITILGGTTAGKSAAINNITGTQTVATSGTISITGGTATGTGSTCNPAQSGSCANISSQGTGLQTVTANAINAQGGSGGVSNGAGIFVNAGPQQLNIGAGGLQLTGGGGVSDNFVTFGGSGANGQTLTINVAGNTVLTGGTGTNASAFIGLGGTGSNGSVIVNFNGTGNLTLNAGSGSQAAASIGAGGNQANATATVTIGAADIILNDSSATIARLGHSSTNNGPGNIVVNATGNVALNGAGGQGTAIRTTGNVTLHADSPGKSITEAANSIIAASALTATANAGLNLAATNNAVSTFNATNAASGNVSLTTTLPLTITGISQAGGGSVIVNNNAPSNTGTIAITGPVNAGSGAVNLTANAAISESGGGLISTSGLLTTSSFGAQALNGANAVGSFNAFANSGGNIALNNSSGTLVVTGLQGGDLSIANTGALTINGNVNATVSPATGQMTLSGSNITVQDAFVNAAGAMNVTTGGTLSVLASNNAATLIAGGTQTISANRIVMQAAPSGSFRHAFIQGGAGQNITVGAGGMQLTGGGGGSNNNIEIWQVGSANDQVITVNGGGAVTLTGGAGTQNGVQITNFGKAQSLTFASGGSLNLQGGSGAGNQNNAVVSNQGSGATTQTIAFPSGGAINITGGTVGADNYAEIFAEVGSQLISGNPDITLTGGASGGGSNTPNNAGIGIGQVTAGATQTINARNLSISGGAGGLENDAAISTNLSGQVSTINATGSVAITGGAGTDALAIIGTDVNNANITVNAAGPITLTSGSGPTSTFGPVAAIGVLNASNVNVTLTSGGTVTLNGPLAQIGTFQGSAASGAVNITGSSVALGGGIINTAGPVTLLANGGQITQTTGSILSPTLTAKTLNNAGGVISLGSTTNTPTTVNLQSRNAADTANANGAISYAVASGIDLANISTGGNAAITAAGAIANSGALSIGGNANFNAGSGNNITLGSAAPVNFGSLTFVGNAVSINESSSTQLAGASSAASLALISAGAITNAAGASLNVTNNASFFGTSIDLGNQAGDLFNFGTLTYNSAGAVAISEDSDMAVTGTNTAGSLVLTSTGAITEAGTSQTVTGDATFTGTSITFIDQPADLLSIGGNATLTATGGGSISLTQGTANFGTVAVNTTGSVTLVESSSTTLSGSTAGSLTLTSTGSVTQTAPLTVTGTTSLTSSTGSITLTNTTNDFGGVVTATAPTGISLTDANTLTAGAINAGTSSLTLTASSLTGSGPVSATTATLSSSTPVSGLQVAVTDTLTLTGSATNWTLTGPVIPTTVVAPPTTLGTFNSTIIGNPVSNPVVQTAVTAGQAAVQTATQTTSTSTTTSTTTTSTTVAPSTVSFSTSLSAPTSSPITISSTPTTTSTAPTTTTAPTSSSTTTTTTTTASTAPSDTSSSTSSTTQTASTSSSTSTAPESSSSSSSSTQTASTSSSSSTTSTAESSSSSSSSSSTSSGGEAQGTGTTQTASTSRSGESSESSSSSGQQQGSGQQRSSTSSGGRQTASTSRSGTSAARAMTPLMAAMADLHAQKAKALESAVSILEKNPAAADLKGCGGAQLAGNCIASRPAQPLRRTVATPTQAALPAIERKVALLIGVGDYRGAIPKLNSPIKDITEIGKIYREQFGYEVRTLPNADKATIIREFNRLILETGPNDSVTVFYAGHGQLVEKTGRGYWIPARASADDPSQWISNQDIGKALENIPAKQVLLVSDSCYSGSLTRDAKVQKDEVLADPTAVLTRRSVTVLSSGAEEPVADAGKDGHSVFAWHFMQSLRNVQGWEKGIDVYGKLADDVHKDFPQEPQYGEAIGSGHQRGGDFLFEVRKY